MNCIIVDDEPLAREGMEMNVREVSYLNLMGQFGNALKANDFLLNNNVDLMFLDIQMPGITGLEFLQNLKDKPLVILTTAYPQYALEGYELDVVDYLVKPIRLSRFLKAVNKAKELHELRINKEVIEKENNEEFIYLKADRQLKKVFLQNIDYIEGMKDYVIVYAGKQKIITAMNLKTIHEQLPSKMFARTSKSFIINVHKIESVESDLIHVAGKELPLGRTYKDAFIGKHVKDKLVERK